MDPDDIQPEYYPERDEAPEEELEPVPDPPSCAHFSPSQAQFESFPIILQSPEYRFNRLNNYPSCSQKELNKQGQYACSYAIGAQHECPKYASDPQNVIFEHKTTDADLNVFRLVSQRYGIGMTKFLITQTSSNEYGEMTLLIGVHCAADTNAQNALATATKEYNEIVAANNATVITSQKPILPVSYLAKLVN